MSLQALIHERRRKMIYSRISKTDPARREKLEDHVRKVAELCSQDGRWFGASSLGHLIGLVHDVGKASYSWQHYLLSSEQEEKIPHAPVGAKMLYQIADEVSVDKWGKYAVEIVALVVWGHHSGLSDVIMPDATSASTAATSTTTPRNTSSRPSKLAARYSTTKSNSIKS